MKSRSVVILTFLLTLFRASLAQSASVVVGTGTSDSCTEAAFNTGLAQVMAVGGTLTFSCGAAPYTLTVTSPKLITSAATIDGGGLITLSGGGTTTILELNDNLSLLTVENLTFSDGYATPAGPAGVCRSNACGGAIRGHFRANLTVINCQFTNNQAVASPLVRLTSLDYGGGAIYLHTGFLTVQDSHFSNNQAQNASGGAIHLLHSNATITNSTFDSNHSNYYGGAIYTDGMINDGAGISAAGSLQFTQTIFNNNGSLGQGGAVFNYLYINRHKNILIEYQDVTFENNSVGLDFQGDAYGGALRIGNGPARIYNTSFLNNTAQKQGGALWIGEASNVFLWNSTFYNNDAVGVNSDDGFGGAIDASSGILNLRNVTLANNHAGQLGGGIWSNRNNVNFVNTILADNSATNPWGIDQNCSFTFSGSHNSIQWPGLATGDTSCGSGIVIANPLLDPPADNGGNTFTMALETGSSAIDGADSSFCLETDQRGRFRTFDGDWSGVGECDIGAFEYTSLNNPAAANAPPYRNIFITPVATITWNPATGAVGYEIELDNNSDFSSVNGDYTIGADTLSVTTNPLQGGLYYWHVRAKQSDGMWSSWSNTDTFFVYVP